MVAVALGAAGLAGITFPVVAATSPQISIGDASVHEGDAKNRSVILAVTLSEPAVGLVTVDYVVNAVDAKLGIAKTANADFDPKGGKTKTLTFRPGQVAKSVSVVVYPDTVVEADGTPTVALSHPTGGPGLGTTVGTGVIVDDDTSASNLVSVGDATVDEGDVTKWRAKFRVTLTEPAAGLVTVDYTIVPVTATGAYKRVRSRRGRTCETSWVRPRP